MSLEFTASEMMSVTAARALTNDMTCFVGIGLPSEAVKLLEPLQRQRLQGSGDFQFQQMGGRARCRIGA